MANYGRVDESLMQPGIPTGTYGFDLLYNGFNEGTREVKNLLHYECEVVMECKVCRNFFRNLSDFVAHKNTRCTRSVFAQAFRRPNVVEEIPDRNTSPNNQSPNSVVEILANTFPHNTPSESGAVTDANEKEEVIPSENATEKNANEQRTGVETARDNCDSDLQYAMNFLNDLVKRVEPSLNVANVFSNPLHRRQKVNSLLPQTRFPNGVQAGTNVNDLNGLSIEDGRNSGDNSSFASSTTKERDSEGNKTHENLASYRSLKKNGLSGMNSKPQRQRETVALSPNLREKRHFSPYNTSEFISSWPKRSNLSQKNCSSSPNKKSTNRRPPQKPSSNRRQSSLQGIRSSPNVDKFPVIFTQKQKQDSLAMMDSTKLKCRECNASFTNKCNMERHCYMHLGFVRFVCSKCEMGAFYRTELRRHLRGLCPNMERGEGGLLNDDDLNGLILAAFPDEPGKVLVWKKRTTWSNNFKGRSHIVYKPSLRKYPVIEKKNDDASSV